MFGLQADVKYLRRAILVEISKHAGKPVKIDVIADTIGCHRNTLYNHIKALIIGGYVQTIRRGQHGVLFNVTEKGLAILEND